MAFTFTNLGGDSASGSNAQTYASGSVSPAANRLLLAVGECDLSGTISAPSVSGLGLTWSQIAFYEFDTSGTHYAIAIFGAITGGSPPTPGAVTFDWGVTVGGGSVIVDQVDGADISGTVANAVSPQAAVTGNVDHSDAGETASLGTAPTSGNATYATFCHEANEGTTHDSGGGWAELGDVAHSGPSTNLETQYHATGAQTCAATWSTSSGHGSIIIELLAASTGSEGALDATLPAVEASFNGTQEIPGAFAAATAPVEASLSGVMQPEGQLAAATAAVEAAFAGEQAIPGALGVTLGAVTAAFVGVEQPEGALDTTLGPTEASFAGEEQLPGALAASISPVQADLTGVMEPAGALGVTLGAVRAGFSGTATEPSIEGALAATLAAVEAVFSGEQTITGAIAAALQPPSASFDGTVATNADGSIGITLPALLASFVGTRAIPPLFIAGLARNAPIASGPARDHPIATAAARSAAIASGIARDAPTSAGAARSDPAATGDARNG